jgi:hypothetical protein
MWQSAPAVATLKSAPQRLKVDTDKIGLIDA